MLASNWCCLAEAVRLTLTPVSGLRCGAMMSTIWGEKAAYMSNCSILAWPHLCRYSRKYVALTLRGFGQIYSLGVYLCFPSPVLKEAKTFLWLFFFSDLYSCFPLFPLPASVNIGFLGTLKPMKAPALAVKYIIYRMCHSCRKNRHSLILEVLRGQQRKNLPAHLLFCFAEIY